jgi:hypothetical protein
MVLACIKHTHKHPLHRSERERGGEKEREGEREREREREKEREREREREIGRQRESTPAPWTSFS